MTEAEWLSCTDPLEFLRGKASDRKLRLFACGCCRRVWNYLWSGNIGQAAILTAERYADGLATVEELNVSRQLVKSQLELYPGEPVYDPSYWACESDVHEAAQGCAGYAANLSTLSIAQNAKDFDAQCDKRSNEESVVQVSILHDIFGPLPFHSIRLDPAWLLWNGGMLRSMAQGIYDDRTFYVLPVLSDALEEAGCSNTKILTHCRQEGEHVRGCWVVDLILGKE